MTEISKTNPVVFDAGGNLNFSLSKLAFVAGICVCYTEQDAAMLRNYISQTGEDWKEVPYDSTNPRHNPALRRASNAHIITGIQDSGGPVRSLADSIIDGTFSKVMEASPSQQTINPVVLLDAVNEAVEQQQHKPLKLGKKSGD